MSRLFSLNGLKFLKISVVSKFPCKTESSNFIINTPSKEKNKHLSVNHTLHLMNFDKDSCLILIFIILRGKYYLYLGSEEITIQIHQAT